MPCLCGIVLSLLLPSWVYRLDQVYLYLYRCQVQDKPDLAGSEVSRDSSSSTTTPLCADILLVLLPKRSGSRKWILFSRFLAAVSG